MSRHDAIYFQAHPLYDAGMIQVWYSSLNAKCAATLLQPRVGWSRHIDRYILNEYRHSIRRGSFNNIPSAPEVHENRQKTTYTPSPRQNEKQTRTAGFLAELTSFFPPELCLLGFSILLPGTQQQKVGC